MKRTLDLSVYLVTDSRLCAQRGLVDTVRAAVAGGASVVQLRDKEAPDEDLIEQGRALKAALAGTGVPLIINDRLRVAAAIGAEGVHVGQADASIDAVRELLGPTAIVGLSIQTIAQARALAHLPIDYVGIGPVFATATKTDHAAPLGCDGLAAVRAATDLPAVAIGGLQPHHAACVLNAGCDGLAVVSAVCGQPDPEAAAAALTAAIRRHRDQDRAQA
jgi:thiamine-phosphate pyrophosphorylase